MVAIRAFFAPLPTEDEVDVGDRNQRILAERMINHQLEMRIDTKKAVSYATFQMHFDIIWLRPERGLTSR